MDIANMSIDMIPQLSTAIATSNVQNAAATSMLAKTIDVTEQGAAALLDMMRRTMENSVNPHLGSNFDVSI